ncbi:MAG: PorT family protein [Muribaculaceae bacterium]|nr:PorT family protein [Muribaculaceae bacterium]
MSYKTLLAVLLLAATVLPVTAQVRLGVRGGITVSKLRFDRKVIDSDNRVGYTGGLVLDINIPVVGLGVEASAMYTHRDNRLSDGNRVFKRHYIDIPVMARFRLPISGVSHIFAPLVYTGPCFSVLFDENAPDDFKNRKTCMSWDVGAGADLFNHLRLTATYGIGMSKAMSYINRDYNGEEIHGKDRHWTVSAAWLF